MYSKMIPIILRLKKQSHKEIAKCQDLIVEKMVDTFDKAVLHGGTAIWRCFKGNRFSEDIDVYLRKDNNKINLFFKDMEKKGFIIEKKKISKKSLYSKLNLNGVIVRFEALFKNVSGALKEYETVEGNLITVYTLTPEEFVNEKIDTYIKRLKVRDLYDIFFLLRYVTNKTKVENKIKKLINNFKKPIDEKELKVLILEGLIPDSKKMLEYIKSLRWGK